MKQGTGRKKQKKQAVPKNLPCQKNDRAVITIEDIGSGGEGIGFLKISGESPDTGADLRKADSAGLNKQEAGKKTGKKGFAIFVKDAVPGDTIDVTVTKVTSRYAYGHLDRIQKPSENRVEPRCPIAKTCGGCQIQALDYTKQLAFKQKKVRENLIRIGGFALALQEQRTGSRTAGQIRPCDRLLCQPLSHRHPYDRLPDRQTGKPADPRNDPRLDAGTQYPRL